MPTMCQLPYWVLGRNLKNKIRMLHLRNPSPEGQGCAQLFHLQRDGSYNRGANNESSGGWEKALSMWECLS